MKNFKMILVNVLFLTATLGSLVYVGAKLDQFNEQITRELVQSLVPSHSIQTLIVRK